MALVEKFIRVGDGSPLLWRGSWITATDYAVDDVTINDGVGYSTPRPDRAKAATYAHQPIQAAHQLSQRWVAIGLPSGKYSRMGGRTVRELVMSQATLADLPPAI